MIPTTHDTAAANPLVQLHRRSGRPGRPPVRQQEIADWLRSRIVAGDLAPGNQLPSRRDLSTQFGAGLATVQAALDQLTEEGFVESRSTAGTYVHDAPPHLAEYVLVFTVGPGQVHRNRFWSGLERHAQALPDTSPYRVRCVYVPQPQHPGAAREAREALEHVVLQGRLSGLIFATNPWMFAESPILMHPGIPRAAIMNPLPKASLGFATVCHDGPLWINRALQHLKAQGRRRIALLTLTASANSLEPAWEAAVRAHGLETRPHWLQCASQDEPDSARRTMRLLMTLPPADRPDALVINDDNLVESAVRGILAAGIHLPGELAVVAHCNFPSPSSTPAPVTRLGFDIAAIFATCVAACRQQERGGALPPHFWLPPVFEAEHASLAQFDAVVPAAAGGDGRSPNGLF